MSAPCEKSREEILQERKRKKRNKGTLNKKEGKELNEKNPDCSSSQSTVADVILKSESDKNYPNDKSEIENSENKMKEENVNKNKVNKSREEILAEREAKKLAKQTLKNKNKEESASIKEEVKEVVKLTENISLKNEESNKLGEQEIGDGKTKAQIRAERRAKQEAQRAKKLENKSVKEKKDLDPEKISQVQPKPVKSSSPLVVGHKVKLFSHLYSDIAESSSVEFPWNVHPSIVRLGTRYRSRVVSGANVRCLALLNALKKVITDYETPPNQELSRGLEAEVTKSMKYLNKCRPVAVSMVNAVKHLKYQMSQVKGNEIESKSQIKEWIDVYIKEQLETAAEAISISVRKKITTNDVILTYGCSSLIQRILISAHKEKINFRVIVVDGRPYLEGREMLRKLVGQGIHCTYIFVNGLSFIMPEVTKILLGAHALLTNGYVMSRVGSSQIALLAKAYNVPVLVCCETYKFSERVQTDSFVYNELGNPDELVSSEGCLSQELSKWKSIPFLTPLHLKYDVTPPDLVSAVVTEIAVLPCTSVPVILRIKPPEISG